MKGTVVATWMRTNRKLFGDSTVNEAMDYVGWGSGKIFSPIENVDDGEVKKIIAYIAKKQNMELGVLWRKIGQDNIKSFSQDYPAFFKHDNVYSFLKSMFDVHVVMTKKFTGAKPPLVLIEPISSREAIFSYNSSRGMFDYFLGMLDGSCEHFNEKVNIEEISRTDSELKLKLIFDKDIYYSKKYLFNRLLSLGFIKNFGVKVGLFTFIISAIVFLPLLGMDNIIKAIIGSAAAGIGAFAGVSLMMSPMSQIKEELGRIINNQYNIDGKIVTNDFFEEIYDLLKSHKKVIQADFVGFKGVTDEMNTFVNTINIISESMDNTSNEISGVVEQVADGAVTQAQNTDIVAQSLNDNITALRNIVENENSNKLEQSNFTAQELAILKQRRAELIAEGKRDALISKIIEPELKRSASSIVHKITKLIEAGELLKNPNKRGNMQKFDQLLESARQAATLYLGDDK